MKLLKRLIREDDGASLVEYGLLVALIAAVAVGTIALLGPEVRDAFQTVLDEMP